MSCPVSRKAAAQACPQAHTMSLRYRRESRLPTPWLIQIAKPIHQASTQPHPTVHWPEPTGLYDQVGIGSITQRVRALPSAGRRRVKGVGQMASLMMEAAMEVAGGSESASRSESPSMDSLYLLSVCIQLWTAPVQRNALNAWSMSSPSRSRGSPGALARNVACNKRDSGTAPCTCRQRLTLHHLATGHGQQQCRKMGATSP